MHADFYIKLKKKRNTDTTCLQNCCENDTQYYRSTGVRLSLQSVRNDIRLRYTLPWPLRGHLFTNILSAPNCHVCSLSNACIYIHLTRVFD